MSSQLYGEEKVKEQARDQTLVKEQELLEEERARPQPRKKRYHKYCAWGDAENYAYITYLSNFKWSFQSQSIRKKYQVFNHMAKFITNRDHKQVKSHHQKMVLKYGSIDETIQSVATYTLELIRNRSDLEEEIRQINRTFEIFYATELRLESDKHKPIKREKRKRKTLDWEQMVDEDQEPNAKNESEKGGLLPTTEFPEKKEEPEGELVKEPEGVFDSEQAPVKVEILD